MQQKIKDNSLVTVIVPAYNEEKHIEECLVSIEKQTYPKIELIVIDDGSKDSTPEIAKRYADIFMSQKHQGPGTARNKAAKIAKGEILIFIDADMYLDKNYVKQMIAPISEGKAKATFTKEEYVANSQNIWVKCYLFDNGLNGDKKNIESDKQKNYFRVISRETFKKLGGYNIKMGYNDDELLRDNGTVAQLVSNARSFHHNPDSLLDIFFSSRWMGRSPKFQKTIKSLLRYSILNSIRISILKIQKGAPIRFIFYKTFFDSGIFFGILFKNEKNNFSK